MTAAPPSEICEALPGGDGAVRVEGGPQLAQRLDGGLRANALVGVDDDRVALPLGDGHGHDLLGELPVLDGGRRPFVGQGGELVLPLAGDTVGAVVPLGAEAHGAVVEGAEQPVVHHRVDQGAVAEPVAGAGAGEQVGRLGHRLHAAGHHDVGVAGVDEEVGQVDGVEARQADLVDGGGRHGDRDAGLGRGLAGGDLAGPGLDDLPHEDVVDALGCDPGALEGAGDGEAAEVHGGEAGQRTRQLADGGAGTCDDDGP